MALPTLDRADVPVRTLPPMPAATDSAVSWGAIVAGAAATASLALILLILGTGLGLSSMSPWASQGASAGALGVAAILWLTLTQVIASGLGGYIAGRLRTAWVGVHTDEVHFRDTAHGFLAWALASLLTAALLTSVIGSIVGGGAQAGAAVAGGAAAAVTHQTAAPDETGYFVEALFRKVPGAPADAEPPAAMLAESTHIFASAMRSGTLQPDDLHYLGQAVAQRTGLSETDAEARVNSVFTRMQTTARAVETATREAADKARKASAYAALWLFISLLMGAFFASLAATFGGRERDR